MKYLLVVHGTAAENEAERAVGMQKMAEWYQRLGPAVVDPGSPFSGAARTVADGRVDDGAPGPTPTGYTILRASSLADATEMASGCPLLKSGRTIAVYETFDAM